MQFCCTCGCRMDDESKFCPQCGTPVNSAPPVNSATPVYPEPIFNEPVYASPYQQSDQPPQQNISIPAYTGMEQNFSFMGRNLSISSGMDAFNFYRKEFRTFARYQARALEMEYRAKITDLDAFFIEFPKMYAKYRQPLLDCAMKIILQTGVFDLSAKQFEEQHTADFCLCGEDVDVAAESFNLTIEANQERKARMYNMMPGVIFSGIGGFAAALALNVAVNSIAEADIRNANVSKSQRAEIFGRIDTSILMERAFLDYWRVFLSMTWQLNRKGIDVWYPNTEDNESAQGLLQNLSSGMLPAERVPDLLIRLIQLNPYADDPLLCVRQHIGETYETIPIFEYFGLED